MATYKVWMRIEMERKNGNHEDIGEPEPVSFSRPSAAKNFMAKAENYTRILSDARTLATILAALRMWQADVTESENFPEVPMDFAEIVFGAGRPLDSGEIDALCSELNQ